MKHEWRKHEKDLYLPKQVEVIDVKTMNYYTIEGQGNPNSEEFQEKVGVLYAMSYGIRMMHKQGLEPDDFYEYTVYPLEGEWTLSEAGIKQKEEGVLELSELVYKIMIRQPDFVTEELALDNIKRVSEKKPHKYNELVNFESIEEGLSVQMIHVGPFATESETFDIMSEYTNNNKLRRTSYDHKEVYLSDPRKSKSENLKTLLRFKVKRV